VYIRKTIGQVRLGLTLLGILLAALLVGMPAFASDGTPTAASAANNSLSASSASVMENEKVTLTATGDRQTEAGAVIGDERYVPKFWKLPAGNNNEFRFIRNEGQYKSEFSPSPGAYTVTSTFQKQTWDGSEWKNVSGQTDTKTVTITAGMYWSSVENKGLRLRPHRMQRLQSRRL
jgi:hypothetical protein